MDVLESGYAGKDGTQKLLIGSFMKPAGTKPKESLLLLPL